MIEWNKQFKATHHNDPVTGGHGITLHGKESTLHFTVIKWHSFDDFGQTIETVLVRGLDGSEREIYSMDEGDTFSLELQEA